MVVQLSILGYVLVPIFQLNRWWLVALYAGFMLMVASVEAVQRPSYSFAVGPGAVTAVPVAGIMNAAVGPCQHHPYGMPYGAALEP